MFDLSLPSALALVAGVSVVVQQVLNANLRSELNWAVWSGFMSYFLGVLCMVGLVIMLREPISTSEGALHASHGGLGVAGYWRSSSDFRFL
jgi:uncharacterized membrane protein YdcZ (DUF606 family)